MRRDGVLIAEIVEIVEAGERIMALVADRSSVDFEDDPDRRDALLWNFHGSRRGRGSAVGRDQARPSRGRLGRMGTTQSAIARIEGGGARPSLDTLERLAAAVGKELVVGVGDGLSENRSIAKLVRDGHAVVRAAS